MENMLRLILIVTNYLALAVLFIAGILGVLITRGQGFEIHFIASMISLALTMTGHIGSALYMTLRPVQSRVRIPLIIENFLAAGFYLWATYAGFMIRQGVPFDYHFSISISSFVLTTTAHVFSPLFLLLKYKEAGTPADEGAVLAGQ